MLNYTSGFQIYKLKLWVICLIFLQLFFLSACSREEVRKLKIGDDAPTFSLVDMEGKTIRLADMKGASVILRFFLTDCTYCRADTPVFNDFYEKYSDQGLRVLYIDSIGMEPKVVKTFVKELGIVFPVVQDKEGKVSASYNVKALPQTIILNPNHKIIAAILGGVSEQQLSQLLSSYFTKSSETGKE